MASWQVVGAWRGAAAGCQARKSGAERSWLEREGRLPSCQWEGAGASGEWGERQMLSNLDGSVEAFSVDAASLLCGVSRGCQREQGRGTGFRTPCFFS